MNKILRALGEAGQMRRTKRAAGGTPRTALPLAAYYRGDPDQERARQEFYMAMARFYGFENWWQPVRRSAVAATAGRDGRGLDVLASRKSVLLVDSNAAPFEWLVFGPWLNDDQMCTAIASIRTTAGLTFRSEREKSQLSPLRSPDLDAVPGGASGARPLAMTWLEAVSSISRLKHTLSDRAFLLLERVVYQDEWLFRGPDQVHQGKSRAYVRKALDTAMITELTCALDAAAVHYGLLPADEYAERWGRS